MLSIPVNVISMSCTIPFPSKQDKAVNSCEIPPLDGTRQSISRVEAHVGIRHHSSVLATKKTALTKVPRLLIKRPASKRAPSHETPPIIITPCRSALISPHIPSSAHKAVVNNENQAPVISYHPSLFTSKL